MTDHRVACLSRSQNFGITCVRAFPHDSVSWCEECRDRRKLRDGMVARMSDETLDRIKAQYERCGVISTDDARLLLTEVRRVRA
jgi:hypothetical protein